MTSPAASIMIAVADASVFLRVSGRACFSVCVDFKKVMQELVEKGYSRFTLDLTQCTIMDSTFLGILTGLSLRIKQAAAPNQEAYICLMNANERVTALFDNLGVTKHFHFSGGVMPDLTETIACQSTSPIEMATTSLEAHQILMEVDPKNIPKFKDVAQFLAEDLKKLGNQ